MDMLAALRLQIEWGADEALDDAPIDRTARPPARLSPVEPAASQPLEPAASQPVEPAASQPVELAASQPVKPAASAPAMLPSLPAGRPALSDAARAQLAAEGAHTLEALYRAVAGFDCALAATATNMALVCGNPESGLVLVGEAPGDDEDRSGRPFEGPAGQLLDRMLASIGLSRRDLLLTNLIPWRPPGGRAPNDAEIQLCAPFLWRHLTLLRPRVIVTLGVLPARQLTGRRDTIHRLRGRWHIVTVPGLPAPIPTLPMMHPTAVPRTPAAKKDAWTDLVALRKHLDSN